MRSLLQPADAVVGLPAQTYYSNGISGMTAEFTTGERRHATGCREQGEPWADSWIPRSWLTADLQSLGKIRPPRSKSERADDAATDRVVCLRPSPRLAGVAPVPGLR